MNDVQIHKTMLAHTVCSILQWTRKTAR